jgi:hemerythrin-like domain-containing protein
MAEHGEMEYYSKELKELKKRVSNCDTRTLDSIEFFLTQANTRMAGISRDVEKEVQNEMHRFTNKCNCRVKPEEYEPPIPVETFG